MLRRLIIKVKAVEQKIAAISAFIFPVVDAEFPSIYSLPQSILRLREASEQRSPFQWALHVEFSDTHVELSRAGLLSGNPHAPVFSGHLEDSNGLVILRGQFGMNPVMKKYRSSILTFTEFIGLLALSGAILHASGRGLPHLWAFYC